MYASYSSPDIQYWATAKLKSAKEQSTKYNSQQFSGYTLLESNYDTCKSTTLRWVMLGIMGSPGFSPSLFLVDLMCPLAFLLLVSVSTAWYHITRKWHNMWPSTRKPTISRQNWFRDMSHNRHYVIYLHKYPVSMAKGRGLILVHSQHLSSCAQALLWLYEPSIFGHASLSPPCAVSFYGEIYKQVCGEQITLQAYKQSC